jgi:hypothetical protein
MPLAIWVYAFAISNQSEEAMPPRGAKVSNVTPAIARTMPVPSANPTLSPKTKIDKVDGNRLEPAANSVRPFGFEKPPLFFDPLLVFWIFDPIRELLRYGRAHQDVWAER